MKKYYIFLCSYLCFSLISCHYFKQKDEDNKVDPKNPAQVRLEALNQSLIDSPKNAKLYFERAKLQWKQNENQLALADFYMATTYDSTKAEYFETLADFMVANLNIDRGILALDHAIKLDPYTPRYHLKQGKYCIYQRKYQSAINHLNNALKRDQFYPEAYFYKGMVYMESKKYDKAISNLMTATEQDPTWDEPYELLGSIYAEQKNDLCLKYFDNAAAANPNNTTALSQKAYYLKSKGKIQDAAKVYEEQVIRSPQNADALYNLGVISYDLKDYTKSLKNLEICLKVDPSNALAYYMLGKNHQILGKIDKAKEAFQQAFIFDSTIVEAKVELNKIN